MAALPGLIVESFAVKGSVDLLVWLDQLRLTLEFLQEFLFGGDEFFWEEVEAVFSGQSSPDEGRTSGISFRDAPAEAAVDELNRSSDGNFTKSAATLYEIGIIQRKRKWASYQSQSPELRLVVFYYEVTLGTLPQFRMRPRH